MEPTDEALALQAVRLGDTEAFETLIRRHQRRILHLQWRLAGNRALAEDLCQDTFLRAWRKLPTYRGGRFAAWLTRIGYNVFLAHQRRPSTRAELPLSAVAANGCAAGEARRDSDELPDLPRLLAALSEPERLVLLLSYGQGLTNGEVAELLDQPVGTIKSQIHRAKEKIRAQFGIGAADEN